MDNTLIYGATSTVSLQLKKLLLKHGREVAMAGTREGEFIVDATDISTRSIESSCPLNFEYYVFNIGILYPKTILEQSEVESLNSININLLFIVKSCEYILRNNPTAKVVIIGSESGTKGSYDTTYFLAKASLRAYVNERKVGQHQSIVLISPSTIEDARMTLTRTDQCRLTKYRNAHPKNRFLSSEELARIVFRFLDPDFAYISNTELEVNGGKLARMG